MRHVFGHSLRTFTFATFLSASCMLAYAEKPTLKGADLLCNGESFFAASNICSELTRLARADGVLPSSESFKQAAVSGAPIASIVNQYKNHNPKPTYLVSDGAGIDLMSSNNMQSLGNTLKQYLEEMKKGGTKCLLWMIYPDPQGGNWGTLKTNQDLWAIEVPKIMKDVTEPKVTLVDLRKVWEGKYGQYTTDGIHCTNAGGTATAEAFWNAMKADDWAFFDTGLKVSTLQTTNSSRPSSIVGTTLKNGKVAVSLSLDKPSDIALRLTTVSGRTILSAKRQTTGSGLQTVEFKHAALAKGVYCCQVTAGSAKRQFALLVP